MSFTIYPAIDLRGGKVVRLKAGDPRRLTAYSDDPLKTAQRWLEAGADWLHVVNLDGAFGEGDAANQLALRAILKLDARVQFGGGMRSLDAIQKAIDLGVSRVVLGTIAVEQPEVVEVALKKFGAEFVAVGIDAQDGYVRLHGWKERSQITPTALAHQMQSLGLHIVIFTDISRDGLGSGLNIASTRELALTRGLEVIASGGVHTLEDVYAARDADLAGVIIGRALYEGTIDLKAALESNVS
ncbi:MAG TPA: 1-(5-phosphoribosyl)-5-[(5-phosphoribosylamino)methylideneamino]imidazole-4-carboxamide isomerase [Anaerolineales bacterium]|nr:1-(5-phosphoribosyl)-5-[(5-phosphoribosylamino)methylideneamino]imidazole-4-carboxamide isomerase [Anaerolineales bacterium]